jgi:hypothetical protein
MLQLLLLCRINYILLIYCFRILLDCRTRHPLDVITVASPIEDHEYNECL